MKATNDQEREYIRRILEAVKVLSPQRKRDATMWLEGMAAACEIAKAEKTA